MTVKVSVVVPVYNPGSDIEPGVESFLKQTLPPEEFEVVYVDDGSTDDTPARLKALADAHEHFRVITIPNSGWPGRPRNIGVDEARGEYVHFVDQDDRLAPDALRRLYEMGRRNGSDIVIGKVASNFRPVPHAVFDRDRDRCTFEDAPLIECLTPHKMFRTAFLREHDLRFPEGRWIWEDHLFVAKAFFAADVISILGTYTCYFYWQRTTGANNADAAADAVEQYRNLRVVLDVFTANTAPGSFRDRLLSRYLRAEVHSHLIAAARRDTGKWDFGNWYEHGREFAVDYMSEDTAAHLGGFLRTATRLLFADDRERLRGWYAVMASAAASARIEGARWLPDGRLELDLSARQTVGEDRRPLELVRRGDRYFLDPELTAEYSDVPCDVTDDLGTAAVELFMRNRGDAVQWKCPTEFTADLEPVGENRYQVVMRGKGFVDTEASDGHGRPARGFWDLYAQVRSFGIVRSTRLGHDRAPDVDAACTPAMLGKPARPVIPYFTEPHGNLTLDTGRKSKKLAQYLPEDALHRVTGAEPALALPIVATTTTASSEAVVVIAPRSGGPAAEAPAVLQAVDGRIVLRLPSRVAGVAAGPADIAVRLDGASHPAFPLGTADVDRRGGIGPVSDLPALDLSLPSPSAKRSGVVSAIRAALRRPSRPRRPSTSV